MDAWPLQMVLCSPGSKDDDKNTRSFYQQLPHGALLKSHRNATSPVWAPIAIYHPYVVDSLERKLTLRRERLPDGVLRETEALEEDM